VTGVSYQKQKEIEKTIKELKRIREKESGKKKTAKAK